MYSALKYLKESKRGERKSIRPKVVVIGGGPEGLMNAWVLGQRGYDVTVFESSDRLGGLMTGTIPAYRLTDETFQEDMARFANLPVHFVFLAEYPKDFSLDDLLLEFDALFVSIGTHKSRGLGIPGGISTACTPR